MKERSVFRRLRFQEPYCHSVPHVQGKPVNIHTSLIFLETRIIDLPFATDSIGLSSFKFLCWAEWAP